MRRGQRAEGWVLWLFAQLPGTGGTRADEEKGERQSGECTESREERVPRRAWPMDTDASTKQRRTWLAKKKS